MSLRLKIIYTGGTLGMQPGKNGLAPAAGLAERLESAIKKAPDYKRRLAEIDWELVENDPLLDSANIVPADWEEMAAQCRNRRHFDAIIIVHGTDTLAYTASALAFYLQNIDVPVIITGAQKPLGSESGDALDNLTGAMLAALRANTGVWVYFCRRLMCAARVVKSDAIHFDAFDTPRLLAPLPDARPSLLIGRQARRRAWESSRVSMVRMLPGYSAAELEALISTRPEAIILALYGLGTLADHNQALLDAIAKAQQLDILVAAVSQCHIGRVDFSVYATGSRLIELGILNGKDMTLEAAYCKLVILLRLGYPNAQIKTLFGQNLANELTP